MERFAITAWCAEDLTDRWKITDDEAKALLATHERTLLDTMISAGWDCLEVLMSGFEEYDDELDDEEDDELTSDSVG
jgi:hypothetical protein